MMDGTGLRAQLFRRKPAAALMAEAESRSGGLKRALGALDLTLLGIGAIVGAGIFVLTGVAAAKYAGPRSCSRSWCRDSRARWRRCAMRSSPR